MPNKSRSTLLAILLPPIMALCCVPVTAQEPAAAASAVPETASASFSTEQLEQLVAPIALYPDSLLTQVLMASTYPLEIVEAERWLGKNPGLEGTALDEAMKEKDWDPSVKSLCTLPEVLTKMSDNLDWTQDLGDAFLEQKDQLLDTVQIMRGKAHDAGNLKTTEQQVITVEKEKIIVIESASPEIVYVPTYSPTVVYAGWGYPHYYYPPFYYPPPPGYGWVTFGVGLAVGAAFWGNCHWGWGHHDVNINVNRYNNFNRNTNINANINNINRTGGQSGWQHDPSHRNGVKYKNQNVASQYGAKTGTSRVSSQQARGWSGTGTANRSGTAAATRQQGAGTLGSSTAANRAQGTAANRPAAATRQQSAPTRNSAYSGASRPQMDRAASSRGSMSRGTPSMGGARSGGRGRR